MQSLKYFLIFGKSIKKLFKLLCLHMIDILYGNMVYGICDMWNDLTPFFRLKLRRINYEQIQCDIFANIEQFFFIQKGNTICICIKLKAQFKSTRNRNIVNQVLSKQRRRLCAKIYLAPIYQQRSEQKCEVSVRKEANIVVAPFYLGQQSNLSIEKWNNSGFSNLFVTLFSMYRRQPFQFI